MTVLAYFIDQGIVESRSRRTLTPEELAIMTVCGKLGRHDLIDRLIQLWMEGTIMVGRDGSWPTGRFEVEIPDNYI
jgi:hypothetical protein